MRTKRDSTEANKANNKCCRAEDKHATAATLDQWNQKERDLAVKKGRADGVATGKTVTRPIYEPAVFEWTMPMDQNFHQLVEQHATRHGYDQSNEGGPPALEDEKHNRDREYDRYPLAGAELCDAAEDADKGGCKMSVKPESDSAIDPGDRIA